MSEEYTIEEGQIIKKEIVPVEKLEAEISNLQDSKNNFLTEIAKIDIEITSRQNIIDNYNQE